MRLLIFAYACRLWRNGKEPFWGESGRIWIHWIHLDAGRIAALLVRWKRPL